MIDLQAWIDAEEQPDRRMFRQAVQLILRAIAQSPVLSPVMIMKGGVLLAIRYDSQRFTKDIDFSTSQKFGDADITALLASFRQALEPVSQDNEHGLALRLQSHAVRPPNRPEVSFPTLKLKIGYANRLDHRVFQRLNTGGSPHVIEVDYSFNEWASETETENLDGGELLVYAFSDLVAEKLRSVLQQPIRKRERYQDIYDLFFLLESTAPLEPADLDAVLRKLLEASLDRGVSVHKEAMRDEQVRGLSRKLYAKALPGELPGPIPDFEVAYAKVQEFYESLPWGV